MENEKAQLVNVPNSIRWIGLCIVWIALFGVTLEQVAGIVRDNLLEPVSRDGYAAIIALFGFLMIMPVALLLSIAIPAVRKRWWLFLGLAPIIALGTALAPAVLG
jgi:hypothetical protein